MNVRIIVAIVLIAMGVVGLAYGGITYTTQENVVDAGPLEVNVEKEHHVPIAPIVGGVLLASGIVVLLVGRKKAAV